MVVDDVYDITILGAGPSGLFAAFYAGLREAKCKIIDSMPVLGGRLMAVYPDKYIYDVGGLPKILAKDLIYNLVEQISPYNPTICLEEHAQELKYEDGIWHIKTGKAIHYSKTLILAGGTGLYSPKKHHAVGVEKFENKGISYAVLDKLSYKDKDVVILGGGDSALDWANELVSIAKNVTLIHRSDRLRAHGASVQKLSQSGAKMHLNQEVIEFLGDEQMTGVSLRHVDTGELSQINCDSAVVLFGFSNTLGKIQEWGFEFYDGGILVNSKMQTNLEGIFAAGDIARYDGKLDLIATGFSEAATAVAFAKNYLNPKVKPQPLYSTTVMEIKEKKRRR